MMALRRSIAENVLDVSFDTFSPFDSVEETDAFL